MDAAGHRTDYDAERTSAFTAHRRLHPHVVEALREGAGVDREHRVLEVGCGPAGYVAALQAETGCRGWGLDPSEPMRSVARARAPGLEIVAGRGENLPFEADRFDLVFSVDVIHHLDDPPTLYREALRVLRRGGRVCTVTDSEAIIGRRSPLSAYFPETVDVELRRYPPIAKLRRWMDEAGFVDLREDAVRWEYRIDDAAPWRARAFSCLHMIPDEAFRRGLERLEADVRRGAATGLREYVLLWGSKPGGGAHPLR